MEFEKLMRERYSCRSFSSKPIEENILNYILEAGIIAPTAKNNQPFRIYVVRNEELLKKMDEIAPCRYGAKCVLVFVYDEKEMWKSPFEPGIHSGVEDVSIVATHVMLRAKDLGIDSVWCNYFPNSKCDKLLNLQSNEKSVLYMPIGYANENSEPAPGHFNKRKFEDLVKYL